MPLLHYDGRSLFMEEGKSVLETLLSAEYDIPNSCHAGVCQSCMMQV
ncbi:MAG: 2Fe-2S iron-sulfur cluster binding domain-containing protein, partial [Gammaproteobacteria bacterium]|nr:2Fe-2S iron-sulfur cluster binding domain-containing protein [Gammaproteobacteria bacterium]